MQPCVVCGSEERTIKSRKLCSKRCERLYLRHNGQVPPIGSCVACGEPFAPRTRTGQRRRVTCRLCPKCIYRPDDCELSVRQLEERDGAVCQICGGDIDMNARRRDSVMAPSIDHVIPRSLGGGHEASNLQLAHLLCNVRKSNKVAA